MLEIVKGELWHLRYLTDNVRPEQRCHIVSEKMAQAEATMLGSYECKTACSDGVPVVLWGVIADSVLAEVGLLWLIGSVKIEEHRMEFLRGSRKEVHKILGVFQTLRCMVDSEFDRSVQWLRWLGFREAARTPDVVLFERRAS